MLGAKSLDASSLAKNMDDIRLLTELLKVPNMLVVFGTKHSFT